VRKATKSSIAQGPIYLHLRGFDATSEAASQVTADVESKLSSAGAVSETRVNATGTVAGVRSLREWMALLGDPMTVGHPITQEPVAVPIDAFAGRDPDSFQLVISWRQYTSVGAAPVNLPPLGTPIIEFD